MRDLLFLSHRIPYPPNKGDKIRSWNMLRHLAADFRVHLGCFVDDPADFEYCDMLRDVCAETYFAPLRPAMGRLTSLSGLLHGTPLTLGYYRHRGLAAWVRHVNATNDIGHAVIFSGAMAQYVMGDARRPDITILDLVDVDSAKWGQYAATKPWPLRGIYAREQKTLLEFERRAAAMADATVLVSQQEADLFRGLAPECAETVGAIENGVDTEFFDAALNHPNPFGGETCPVVFTGAMDYWPNIDAVSWFASEVLGKVRAGMPDATFWIVGSSPSSQVRELEQIPGVRVTGRVPDIRPYLAHATVVTAPLRVAQGVQNKVLEAMAMARPVVATAKALVGIDAVAGRDAICAPETADDFADKVLCLLRDGGADAVGNNGRDLVERRYRWAASLARLGQLLDGETPDTVPAAAREKAPC